MAKSVVEAALFRIAQYLIGFAGLFEVFFSFLVAGISIRMMLESLLAVGFFYFSFCGSPGDAEYFVRRPVRPGRSAEGRVEILAGLEEGQTIVTKGAFLLKSDVLRAKMGAGCAD